MNKTVAIWVLLGLVSSPIHAESKAEIERKALEKSWEKIDWQAPERPGNLAELDYILLKYVYQQKAIFENPSTPLNFRWKCVDLVYGCFQVGQKYSLPDNFYINASDEARPDLAVNPEYHGR